MDEILERVYELKKAALACGLDPDQAVDVVAEACSEAEEVAPDSEERKAVKWWPAFLKYYSVKCFVRWQSKCGDSGDCGAMERLWLEQFEPMWLAGCNYVKDLAVQNVKSSYTQFLSRHSDPGKFSSEDIQKMKQYCEAVADDLKKVLSSEIAKFTVIQRETLSKVIRQMEEEK